MSNTFMSNEVRSFSAATDSSSSSGGSAVMSARDQRQQQEQIVNACVLKHFIGEVKKSYWVSWGRTYLNDKTTTKVTINSANDDMHCGSG